MEARIKDSKVLIVDDIKTNREIIKAIIGTRYRTYTASSGEEALATCNSLQPDLILLDVVMGDMSGLEVCRYLKSDEILRHIPVIFITSLESMASEDDCWSVGAVDFLLKPVNATTLLNRVKAHITLKLQTDFLRQIAYRDGLTGLFNRRYFDEQYDMHLRQAQRSGVNLSLLIVDIDYFKQYNDSLGHLAGDDCLRLVAGLIKSTMHRPLDLVARYGGEEFVALLPETDAVGAAHMAEQLRQCVAERQIDHPAAPGGVLTVSIGVATTRMDRPCSGQDMLAHADAALYAAKQAGRGRYVVAPQ
ncbi:MAG: diguanylate cyclase [Gammaproteobacteria bacterium]|nr:diguanylate cyclase [Gammaproteobacteria bacterium]